MKKTYEDGYRQGFLDGYNAGKSASIPAYPQDNFPGLDMKGCRVCGIGANGEALGYVCPRLDCPTRITATVHNPLL